jgi:hypothetical protein
MALGAIPGFPLAWTGSLVPRLAFLGRFVVAFVSNPAFVVRFAIFLTPVWGVLPGRTLRPDSEK